MKVVSLFAGCGGLDLGFKQGGFDIIWANEFDQTLHETYCFNHPKTILNTKDIRKLSIQEIPDCDGIIGGPPCQSWSEGGKGLGIKDDRGKLFFEFIRIVLGKSPKFFLIENVRGILEEKHKDALHHFLMLLENGGYNIFYKLLNAADYNIPQDRYRVFFIGIKKQYNHEFDFPKPSPNLRVSLKKAIGDLINYRPCPYTLKSLVTDNKILSNHDYYDGPFDTKYMSRNRVRNWEEISFTIQAQAKNIPLHPQAPKMKYISNNKRIFDPSSTHLYRRLSVRECARIQTFPDNFKCIYFNVKDGYKMIGNAVPPRIAKALALQIRKYFNDNKTQDNFLKDTLVGLIPQPLINKFEHRTNKFYYSGRKFPDSVKIEDIKFFIPYIKGKGIRDLYIIKEFSLRMKKEIIKDSTDMSKRYCFDIIFFKQLFNNYKPIYLNIWHTYALITNPVSNNLTIK